MKFINILLLFCLFILLLCMPLSSFGNVSHKEKLFDGEIYLSDLPIVGQEAIVTLDLTAVSADCGETTIVFRMPDGIAVLDRSIYSEPFYTKGMRNQYKTAIKVLKEGVYALQVSVYPEIMAGRQKAEHFYIYLTVTKYGSWINDRIDYLTPSENGFDSHIINLAPPEQARAMATLSIQGRITYYDDNLTRSEPIRNLKVLLIEVKQDNTQSLLGTTQTDDNGLYAFNSANVPKLDDGSVRDLRTRIVFENQFIKITDTNSKTYSFDMPIIQNASSGLLVSDYFLNEANQQRPLGHIFNTALRAYVFLQQKLGWSRKSLPLIWPYAGDLSNYYYGYTVSSGTLTYEAMRITINSQWDQTTFYHEYGHSVMMALYGYNKNRVPQSDYKGEDGKGAHSARTVSDPQFAMNEGWAEFFEALIEDNAFNFTQFSNRNTPNIEYNEWWKGKDGNNTDGEIVEGSVASILWDIVDTPQSIDETPNIDDDNISDMIVQLWDLMAKNRPQKITDLWEHWQENGYGQLEALQAIFADNGINVTIRQVNQPPIAIPMSVETDEDSVLAIKLTGSDPENNALTYTIIEQPKNGKLSGEIPNLIYVPNYGFSGTDSFTFIADDGTAKSAPAKIEIMVNSAPNPFDVNKDGVVDILDIVFVSMYFSKTEFPKEQNPDVNRDGVIDAKDLDIIIGNFGIISD